MNRKAILMELRETLLVVPYLLVMYIQNILSPGNDGTTFSESLWTTFFGSVSAGEISTIVVTIGSMGCFFLFCLLFGAKIQQFFGDISVVFFTRIQNRRRWFLGQCMELFLYAAVYTALTLLVLGVITTRGKVAFSAADALTLLFIFGLLFTILAGSCLLTNWVAIRNGITLGVFVSVAVLLVLGMAATQFFDNLINIIGNPLCFNQETLHSPLQMGMKLGLNLAYLAAIVGAMGQDIEKMNLFANIK